MDLSALHAAGLLPGQHSCFAQARHLKAAAEERDTVHRGLELCAPRQASLNAFMALGRPAWREARAALTRLLSQGEGALRDDAALRKQAIIAMVREQATLHSRFQHSPASQPSSASGQALCTLRVTGGGGDHAPASRDRQPACL